MGRKKIQEKFENQTQESCIPLHVTVCLGFCFVLFLFCLFVLLVFCLCFFEMEMRCDRKIFKNKKFSKILLK